MQVKEKSQWVANGAGSNAIIWTVRGVTEHGVYFTGEVTPGRWADAFLSEKTFLSQYKPVA